jgi:transposase
MEAVATIGLDIAKSVFQVHGVDAEGAVVVQRRLTRARMLPFFEKLAPCLVGIEACAAAQHWARQLRAFGHDVRLMPPAYGPPVAPPLDRGDARPACQGTRPSVPSRSVRFCAC